MRMVRFLTLLNEWDVTNGPENIINSLKNDATAVGYVTNVDSAGVTHYYDFAMSLPGSLPNPDANGGYDFHPKTEGECRYPTDSLPCVFLPNSAYTVYELDVTGQGEIVWQMPLMIDLIPVLHIPMWENQNIGLGIT